MESETKQLSLGAYVACTTLLLRLPTDLCSPEGKEANSASPHVQTSPLTSRPRR